jgi:hypothetical protein
LRKVAHQQLADIIDGQGQNRTADTRIFSPTTYMQLIVYTFNYGTPVASCITVHNQSPQKSRTYSASNSFPYERGRTILQITTTSQAFWYML